MTDIPQEIINYYVDKERDLPQPQRNEVGKLINRLDCAVVARLYHGGPKEDVTKAIDAVVQHPDSTWTREVLEYRIRKLYYS